MSLFIRKDQVLLVKEVSIQRVINIHTGFCLKTVVSAKSLKSISFQRTVERQHLHPQSHVEGTIEHTSNLITVLQTMPHKLLLKERLSFNVS